MRLLALLALVAAQCDEVTVLKLNGSVVAPPDFIMSRGCWSVQTDNNDSVVEITITDFLVDSTPPFCQDLPGFPLTDSSTAQIFSCIEMGPFCHFENVALSCPETCSMCDSCNHNFVLIIGVDGVEYFRGCQTIEPPLTITTQVSNVFIFSTQSSTQDFEISQNRFSFSYRPVPKPTQALQYACFGVQTLTEDNGTFTDGSSLYGSYGSNVNCGWVIAAPPGKFVELTFEQFELQGAVRSDMRSPQQKRCGDAVSIVDGSNHGDALVGQYCGNEIPPVIRSSSQNLTVFFTTGPLGTYPGFTARYRFVDLGSAAPLRCAGNTTYDSIEGEVSLMSGLGAAACSWNIIPPSSNQLVRIEFLTHSLTPSQPECSVDAFIAVYQGTTLLQRSCDEFLPPAVTATSAGAALTVSFSSEVASLKYFHFKWTFVNSTLPPASACSSNAVITAAANGTGVIADGTPYGVAYNRNMRCRWTITAPVGYLIRLDYEYFSLESNTRCASDNVTVFSGDGTLLQTACGTTLPARILSTTNMLVVIFSSDSFVNLDGFSATWSVVPASIFVPPCDGLVSLSASTTGTISSVNNYSFVKNCSWLITAPAGLHVQLTVRWLNLVPREPGFGICSKESLAAWDGNSSTSSYMLFKSCGSEQVQVQVSTGNTMLVTYDASMMARDGGFTIDYSTVSSPGASTDRFCFGVQHYPTNPNDLNGTITNYVRGSLYQPNSRCEFVITAPENKAVQLTWDAFALGSPYEGCNSSDYIAVYDGNNTGTGVLPLTCENRTTISTNNQLTLLFVSNAFTQSLGFKARWHILDRQAPCIGNRSISRTPLTGVLTDNSTRYCTSLDNSTVSWSNYSWFLLAPSNSRIELKFSKLNETGSACVNITDGSVRSSKCFYDFQSEDWSYASVTDNVLLDFTSDFDNANANLNITYAFVAFEPPIEDAKQASSRSAAAVPLPLRCAVPLAFLNILF